MENKEILSILERVVRFWNGDESAMMGLTYGEVIEAREMIKQSTTWKKN